MINGGEHTGKDVLAQALSVYDGFEYIEPYTTDEEHSRIWNTPYVKADKMRRFRRLDTISEEFSKENLQEFFEKGKYQYELPRILTPDVKYIPKPKNSYQQKFYGKIYRMRVVEKC